jgi:hypothetical protein
MPRSPEAHEVGFTGTQPRSSVKVLRRRGPLDGTLADTEGDAASSTAALAFTLLTFVTLTFVLALALFVVVTIATSAATWGRLAKVATGVNLSRHQGNQYHRHNECRTY